MSAFNQTSNHLIRLYKATRYSIAGLRSAFKYEQAFRLEIYLSFILIPLAIWLAKTPIELSLLIGSWILVMIIELFNSAIEAAIDRIGPERHELSGRAKDIGSAAVMLGIFLALFIWLSITLL
ncbi:diacylglycerol kinase [Candidatus Endobugula sertula]|uniref:Diacylglycerol kinase n=1 Tax=Candidatus Endobugula sertula TaxID=62101 RepID=A0A1D2QQX5_9GAMM|nr:diacylglycerol kinase [Candidatus Endobugula sertula]